MSLITILGSTTSDIDYAVDTSDCGLEEVVFLAIYSCHCHCQHSLWHLQFTSEGDGKLVEVIKFVLQLTPLLIHDVQGLRSILKEVGRCR